MFCLCFFSDFEVGIDFGSTVYLCIFNVNGYVVNV